MHGLDRKRQSKWFAGRLHDAEMGEWVGMPEPTVLHLNKMQWMRAGIKGGGKGKRFARRVSPVTRNAIAAAQALSEVGGSLELAVNILAAAPDILSRVTAFVDTFHKDVGSVSLVDVDPHGNWLDADRAPAQIWREEESSLAPKYSVPDNGLPHFDEHFHIVNNRFIFHEAPESGAFEMRDKIRTERWSKTDLKKKKAKRVSRAILMIEDDRKSVRSLDKVEQKQADYALSNFKTFSQVNISLAIRHMKRRAFGLPIREL